MDFHPSSSMFIHFNPFSSIFIHVYPYSSIFIHVHPFMFNCERLNYAVWCGMCWHVSNQWGCLLNMFDEHVYNRDAVGRDTGLWDIWYMGLKPNSYKIHRVLLLSTLGTTCRQPFIISGSDQGPCVSLLKQHEPCKIGQGQQVCCFYGGVVGEFIGNAWVMGSHFLFIFRYAAISWFSTEVWHLMTPSVLVWVKQKTE